MSDVYQTQEDSKRAPTFEFGWSPFQDRLLFHPWTLIFFLTFI